MDAGGQVEVGLFVASRDPLHDDYLDDAKLSRLRALSEFYDAGRLRELVLPFNRDDVDPRALSLRHLYFFLVVHARDKSVVYEHAGRAVRPHDEYRSWQRVWRRRLFDVFRRHARVYFQLDGAWHASTVGQLNFFFFAHTHGLIAYATAARDQIDASMRRHNAERRRQRRRDAAPAATRATAPAAVPTAAPAAAGGLGVRGSGRPGRRSGRQAPLTRGLVSTRPITVEF